MRSAHHRAIFALKLKQVQCRRILARRKGRSAVHRVFCTSDFSLLDLLKVWRYPSVRYIAQSRSLRAPPEPP